VVVVVEIPSRLLSSLQLLFPAQHAAHREHIAQHVYPAGQAVVELLRRRSLLLLPLLLPFWRVPGYLAGPLDDGGVFRAGAGAGDGFVSGWSWTGGC